MSDGAGVKYSFRKTTLGEANGGHCRSRNNTNYTGKTPVYEICADGESHFYVKTARKANQVVDSLTRHHAEWDGKGDLEMRAYNALLADGIEVWG